MARAGRAEDGLAALRLAASIDLDDARSQSAEGLHIATMGSLWQAIVLGFAGLRPSGDALAIEPHIPQMWPELEIRVQFRGVPVRLRLTPDLVIVNVPAPIAVVVGGRRVTCGAGESRLPV